MQHLVAILFFISFFLLVNSVYATGVCLKGYGDTPEEAFKIGANLLNKKADELGKESLLEKLQIRILPEKKKDLFIVLVYSMDKQTSCDLPSKPQPAKVDKANCTNNICTI